MTTTKFLTEKPATDGQKAMIRKIRNMKATEVNPIITDAEIEELKFADIGELKNLIFSLPWPAKKAAQEISKPAAEVKKFDDYADVVNGNYAYAYNGKAHFYRVTREEGKGKWAGTTFINVQERASDELFRVYGYDMKKSILSEIRKAGISESQKLFAEKLGRCWRCGKSLTDELNPYKDQGLGPDCGTKV